jgi:hypothetical protein
MLNLEKLKNVGLALYWAEGTKSKSNDVKDKDGSHRHIEFVNSNVMIIAIFMNFCRTILDVPENKFRCRIQSSRANIDENAKKFWSGVTGIPLSQFTKSRIKEGIASNDYFSCCQIRVNSKDLKIQLDKMLLTLND